jgi:membrane-associated PAP2 superfamily phosphatase
VQRRARLHAAGLAVGALLILLVFRFGGADRFLADLFYDPARRAFPLKDTWLLAVPGHEWLKWAALAVWGLCLALGGPFRRGALYAGVVALAIAALRQYSPFACPWDLLEYGGTKPDAGRCLPAAHPLTGFAFFGLYFSLRDARPRLAVAALAAAWLVGLAAGAVQMARGAHFASHVLWTAWLAWALTSLLSMLLPAVPERRRV